jgi:type VI secretion system protein ImpJ
VIRIFWEDEIKGLGDQWLIPIAKLEREGKEIRLSGSFIPPSISLKGSELMTRIMRSIREQVLSRSRSLAMFKLTKDIPASDFQEDYLRNFFALSRLNYYIPLLHHLMENPDTHPWTAYGLLRQLIGELSTFTERINALGALMDDTPLLPEYDHMDLSTCFSEAQTLIGELLDALIVGEGNVINLIRDGGVFTGHIPPEGFAERNLFCLVVRAPGDPEKIVSTFQRIAKLGSQEEMPVLQARALPGIPMEPRSSPLPGIPRRPDSYYFMLDRRHPQWLEVKRSGNICLQWDDAPEEAAAELVISPW